MEFKKLRQWTKEEDAILKANFYTINPFNFSSHHGSKFDKLNDLLKANGYTDRTPKAVSRRTYRLGLKSYNWNDESIKTYCHKCGVEIDHYKRYKNPLCSECALKQKYAYTKSEKGKKYHAQYYKKWKQKL